MIAPEEEKGNVDDCCTSCSSSGSGCIQEYWRRRACDDDGDAVDWTEEESIFELWLLDLVKTTDTAVSQRCTLLLAKLRLSSQAMASSSLRAQRDQWKTERMHFKIRPERTLGYRTDLYRCEGCGSRDTRVHRAIRAGRHQVDQARTYVTCCECSRRWEEGGM